LRVGADIVTPWVSDTHSLVKIYRFLTKCQSVPGFILVPAVQKPREHSRSPVDNDEWFGFSTLDVENPNHYRRNSVKRSERVAEPAARLAVLEASVGNPQRAFS